MALKAAKGAAPRTRASAGGPAAAQDKEAAKAEAAAAKRHGAGPPTDAELPRMTYLTVRDAFSMMSMWSVDFQAILAQARSRVGPRLL